MDLHLQPDWKRALGHYVEVRRFGEIVGTGTVEEVMPDSSILWISAEGAFLRYMVERAEGYEVYSRYPLVKDVAGPLKQMPGHNADASHTTQLVVGRGSSLAGALGSPN